MVGEVGTPSKDIKASTDEELKMLEEEFRAVSYTHLTLPTK